jgi:hypothetical protein
LLYLECLGEDWAGELSQVIAETACEPSRLEYFRYGRGKCKGRSDRDEIPESKSLGFSVKAESTEMRSLRVRAQGNAEIESIEMKGTRLRIRGLED